MPYIKRVKIMQDFKYCPYSYTCQDGKQCRRSHKNNIIKGNKAIKFFTGKPECFKEKIKKCEKDLTNEYKYIIM
jgi:hypothetical protein